MNVRMEVVDKEIHIHRKDAPPEEFRKIYLAALEFLRTHPEIEWIKWL